MTFADQLKASREDATKILFSKMYEKAIEATNEVQIRVSGDIAKKVVQPKPTPVNKKQPPAKILSLPEPKK